MDDNHVKPAFRALFLPVQAGQSGDIGYQAVAVTLRGIALGELRTGRERALFLGLSTYFVRS